MMYAFHVKVNNAILTLDVIVVSLGLMRIRFRYRLLQINQLFNRRKRRGRDVADKSASFKNTGLPVG